MRSSDADRIPLDGPRRPLWSEQGRVGAYRGAGRRARGGGGAGAGGGRWRMSSAEAPRGPAKPPRRSAVPDDPALPRLPVLLEPDAIAPVLHRSLGPDAPFPDVRVHHVRYAPGTKLV